MRVGQRWPTPWWLPGGNAQTIWPALFARDRRGAPTRWLRERWASPDGDFIDVDHLDANAPEGAPQLVLFHGLEGSSASHYAHAFASLASERGWRLALPHFRGCSGELNRAPRAYHSGDFEEIGWVLTRLRATSAAPVFACGVSLGGNALMRWAEEAGAGAARIAQSLCAISAPLDLAAAGHAITRGFNHLVYDRMFLATMKPKALAKLAQHPGLFDRERLIAARDLYAFDDVFTAPLHGYRGVDDYWARASAKPRLADVRIPALLINARNDPFVPASSLPRPGEVGAHVRLWQPATGGHVGFASGGWPGEVLAMPEAVLDWLASPC
ncbi:MAG TPA: alpha/beta fold hydrolase [Methylibium sp.]|uniref:YheT family hydrolase n=1 Tax=Methylibium sp. TaxID=2067992 RepID=UPI002DB96278|nr:alpha/beta fold hydrolase [Methylibium sp.]HEU4460518.1 alpha/beta fold hydrolase [Methylibium sp.]